LPLRILFFQTEELESKTDSPADPLPEGSAFVLVDIWNHDGIRLSMAEALTLPQKMAALSPGA
jgi:hypothetical protein